MPYRVSWIIENRLLLIAYEGVISRADLVGYLDESMAMRDKANEILGEGGPLVHTITDARRMSKNEMTFKDAQTVAQQLRHQRVGWSIYIPKNAIDQFFANIGHQIVGARYRSFPTVTEGIDFLKSVDETLRNLDYAATEESISRSPFKK